MDLTNKQYVITGAAADSDIGLAICKALDEEGAKLILVGRREESLRTTQQQLNGSHQVSAMDLSELDELPRRAKALIALHGPIDGFVHSASFQGYSPLRAITPKQINQYFDINFSAAVLLTAAFSKPKHYKPGASFVFIGSAAGERGLKARTLYAASKAALTSLVKSAALELASKQIRVNCVAPAVVSGTKADLQFSTLGGEQANALINAHPLGLSTPEDVANSVVFLLSQKSRNTTGVTLAVDGGFLAG